MPREKKHTITRHVNQCGIAWRTAGDLRGPRTASVTTATVLGIGRGSDWRSLLFSVSTSLVSSSRASEVIALSAYPE